MMDEPKYKPGAVAAAAGISNETLRNWQRSDRCVILREPGRLMTFRRAMQVALMANLVDQGIRAEFAARAALGFTDSGLGPLPGRPARDPGELFAEGWTILCVYPGDIYDVKNVQPDTHATELFTPMGMTRSELVTMLNLSNIVPRLRAVLDASVKPARRVEKQLATVEA